MKKILTVCLLALIMIAGSSFTASREHSGIKQDQQSSLIKIYTITISVNVPFGPHGCYITIGLTVYFTWQGVSSPPVLIGYTEPTVGFGCSGGSRTADLSKLEIDDMDAHLKDISFAPTGDRDLDAAL